MSESEDRTVSTREDSDWVVNMIRKDVANIIDILDDHRTPCTGEDARLFTRAMDKMEEALMLAVKGIYRTRHLHE